MTAKQTPGALQAPDGSRYVTLTDGAGNLATSITATATDNITQIGGNTVDSNSGTKSAGTLRVVVATDQPALTNALKVDGSAVTQPVSGTLSFSGAIPAGTNVIGHVIADTGSTTAVTQATAANLNATIVGTGTLATQAAQSGTWTVQPGNTANTTAWKVDGSAVTQPVSIATAPVLVAGSALIGKVGIDQTTPGTTNAVSAAQAGTWTIQPGNTANTTAWKVDGSAVTQPVSGTVTANAAQSGTWTVQPGNTANTTAWKVDNSAVTQPISVAASIPVGASALTGGIPSTARLLSAAGSAGDATNVKASAGRLYSIQGANVAASARYLKLYNSASAPTAGSGTPVKTLYLPPSSAFAFDWAMGLTFSTGIGFTLVTGSADNSSTSVTAADILALNLDYA